MRALRRSCGLAPAALVAAALTGVACGGVGGGDVGAGDAGAGDAGGGGGQPTPCADCCADGTTPFVLFDALPGTTNASPLRVTGHATSGSLVHLTDGSTPLGEIQADATQGWALDVTLAEGAHVLTATASCPSGAGSPAAQATVQIDRVAPTVTSRSPSPGDPDAWIRAPIVARFSEPVEPSTVNDHSVLLTGAGATLMGKILKLSADGLELTVIPAQPPLVPNTLAVSLTTDITDLAGNRLEPPADAWTWSLNLWQTLPAPPALGPWSLPGLGGPPPTQLAMKIGSDGNPILAYCVGSSPPVLTTWSGEAWHTTVTLTTPCAVLGWHGFALDLDASDRFALAWWGGDPSGAPFQLYASVGGSSAPSEDPLGSEVFGYDVRFDPAGTPFVAWEQGYPGEVYASRWDGSAWQPLGSGALNSPTEDATAVRIFFDSDGAPIVSWFKPGGSLDPFLARAKTWTGSSWVDFTHWPAESTEDVASGAFAAAPSDPVVAYLDTSTAPYQARAAASTADRFGQYHWLEYPGPLNIDPAQSASEIALALDAIGAPIVTWTEAVGSGGVQLHVKRWTAAGWSTLGSDLGRLGEYAQTPTIAVGAEGTIMTGHWSWDQVHRVFTLVLRRYNGK
jgi:hypothetical protein